jgi:hypothetical protein
MQPGLIETPNHDIAAIHTSLTSPTTAQHGPGRSLPGSSDARSPLRVRSTSSDTQRSGGAVSDHDLLHVDHLSQSLGWLSVAEVKSAAATPATVAGQRVFDYENAAVSSPPRDGSRPGLGFKVIHSSQSAGVHLTDFPNGSFCFCHGRVFTRTVNFETTAAGH